jgi:hypothetical protein
MKTIGILTAVILLLGGFAALTFFADLDLARWFTCSGPLAQPQDKDSDFCKNTSLSPQK